jgi:hypothetical protein
LQIIHKEFRRITQPVVFFVLAVSFMGPGLIFFNRPLSKWEMSAAESRERNEFCSFLGFYDNHDLWHLLSAPGLFFAFLVGWFDALHLFILLA